MPPLSHQELTRLGAQIRLAQLVAKMDAILEAFPDLGKLPARPKAQVEGEQAEAVRKTVRRRKRSRMSAAQRKAVSERMKRYWAGRRAGKKQQSASRETTPAAHASRRPHTSAPRKK